MTSSLFHIPSVETPAVVGKPLDEAFSILSHHQLTIQLLEQKEDADLADSTVLAQIPAAGQRAKYRQTIFLSLSKQPPMCVAPSFQSKQLATIEQEAKLLKLRLKKYFLESAYPTNSCIAQIPMAGEPIPDKTMIVYIAKSTAKEIIWPNFKHIPVDEVVMFLEQHAITPQIIEAPTGEPHNPPLVIDQRPLAGSIISLDSKHIPIVQLFIR